MDDKNTTLAPDGTQAAQAPQSTWVEDMKQELEDYIEEQGIYIRQ